MGCGIGPLDDFWVGDERFELRYAQALMKDEVVSEVIVSGQGAERKSGKGEGRTASFLCFFLDTTASSFSSSSSSSL